MRKRFEMMYGATIDHDKPSGENIFYRGFQIKRDDQLYHGLPGRYSVGGQLFESLKQAINWIDENHTMTMFIPRPE